MHIPAPRLTININCGSRGSYNLRSECNTLRKHRYHLLVKTKISKEQTTLGRQSGNMAYADIYPEPVVATLPLANICGEGGLHRTIVIAAMIWRKFLENILSERGMGSAG